MIKLASFLIFAIAFTLSWLTFNNQATIGIDIHAGIQSKLAVMIEETLKAKKPNVSDFILTKMHTEKIDDNKIRAIFSYKYTEGLEEKESAQQMIAGEAILSRGVSENPNLQKWIVQSIKTGSSRVEFKEGTVITSDGKMTEPEPESPAESATTPSADSTEPKKNE